MSRGVFVADLEQPRCAVSVNRHCNFSQLRNSSDGACGPEVRQWVALFLTMAGVAAVQLSQVAPAGAAAGAGSSPVRGGHATCAHAAL